MANHAQRNYFFGCTPPAAIVDNAALTCNVIDTLGFDYCELFFYMGATDIAHTVMKVQESDTKSNTTALTSGADVTGLVFGTSSNIAGSTSSLPSSTDDNKCFKCEIDLRGRKRYLLPAMTHGDGTVGGFTTIFALLSKAEALTDTAAGRNYGDILRV